MEVSTSEVTSNKHPIFWTPNSKMLYLVRQKRYQNEWVPSSRHQTVLSFSFVTNTVLQNPNINLLFPVNNYHLSSSFISLGGNKHTKSVSLMNLFVSVTVKQVLLLKGSSCQNIDQFRSDTRQPRGREREVKWTTFSTRKSKIFYQVKISTGAG